LEGLGERKMLNEKNWIGREKDWVVLGILFGHFMVDTVAAPGFDLSVNI